MQDRKEEEAYVPMELALQDPNKEDDQGLDRLCTNEQLKEEEPKRGQSVLRGILEEQNQEEEVKQPTHDIIADEDQMQGDTDADQEQNQEEEVQELFDGIIENEAETQGDTISTQEQNQEEEVQERIDGNKKFETETEGEVISDQEQNLEEEGQQPTDNIIAGEAEMQGVTIADQEQDDQEAVQELFDDTIADEAETQGDDIIVVQASFATTMERPIMAYASEVAEGDSNERPNNNIPETSSDQKLSETQLSFLRELGFTNGLAKTIRDSFSEFPLRIWILDNSGSMRIDDGAHFVANKKNKHMTNVRCTRWTELCETVIYHAKLANMLQAPTMFRLLNKNKNLVGPQKFGVALKDDVNIPNDLETAISTMEKSSPHGFTPLTKHILAVKRQIARLAPNLQREGSRVALIIATDGLPSDKKGNSPRSEQKKFVDALQSLAGLPVWVVIRLCTNDANIVEFYNDLDRRVDVTIEVLDDFSNEAFEVYLWNPWLNYNQPLHRMREMGYHHRLFDFFEERMLSLDEVHDCVKLIVGEEASSTLPYPHKDRMHDYCTALETLLEEDEKHWCPMKGKKTYYVSVKRLIKDYANKQALPSPPPRASCCKLM